MPHKERQHSHMTPLDWLDTQADSLLSTVVEWASINSGSRNTEGLDRVANQISKVFQSLDPDQFDQRTITLDSGALRPLLVFKKRSHLPNQIFLFGHFDTVYGPEHPFQKVQELDNNRLGGPGVCDMKGGLAILFHGLQAFEKFIDEKHFGWTIVLNPDEEIGSPASTKELVRLAERHICGFCFEPALQNGGIATQRKGSGVFKLRFHGKAAHSGRNPRDGRNALLPLAKFVLFCENLNQQQEAIYFNPAVVQTGSSYNVVPDLATCVVNVRTTTAEDEQRTLNYLQDFIADLHRTTEFRADLDGTFTAPPKPYTPAIQELISIAQQSAKEIGISLPTGSTGGTCDGNRLAAADLPNIDNLGARGGSIHSPEEFIYVDSLVERAKLFCRTLEKLNQRFRS
jgi:glutamate carboxypeptidase